jgi:DNA mismatch repair protein MutL
MAIYHPHITWQTTLDRKNWLPDRTSRHRPYWVKAAVNGRFIQIYKLEQTILSNFNRTLPRHRYPLYIVHLSVNPFEIDWNRHPAKTESICISLKIGNN